MRRTPWVDGYLWLLLAGAFLLIVWWPATATAGDTPIIDPDPIWTSNGDDTFAGYGFSAVVGDIEGDGDLDLVVGAPLQANFMGNAFAGKVFVYLGTGSGLPDPGMPDVVLEGEASSDLLGFSLALSDLQAGCDLDLVVGAPGSLTPESCTSPGRVYVYEYNHTPSVYPSMATLIKESPAGPGMNENFGFSVAAKQVRDIPSGCPLGQVIVGAPCFSAGAANRGMVYLFDGRTGFGAPILSDPIWSRMGDFAGDNLGVSVASGDLDGTGDLSRDVIVGAHGFSGSAGRVYVWHNVAIGSLGLAASVDAEWTAMGPSPGDELGASVAAGDFSADLVDDLLVGAHGADSDAGQAHLWRGILGGLGLPNRIPDWTAPPAPMPGSHFGFAVSSAGDMDGDGLEDAIIGAPGADWDDLTGSSTEAGHAYLYLGVTGDGGLKPCLDWDSEGEHAGSFYGWTVGATGQIHGGTDNDMFVGAPKYNTSTPTVIAGNLDLYTRHDGTCPGPLTSGPTTQWPADWTGDNPTPTVSINYGTSVAMGGDYNGDEVDDLIVGVPTTVDAQVDGGRVYGYFGESSGPGTRWLMSGLNSCRPGGGLNDEFGHSVAVDGDFNNDGFDDVIVGGPEYWCDEIVHWFIIHHRGEAFIHFGWDAVPPPSWVKFGNEAYPRFGRAVASAGDVNNDGFDDILVGARSQVKMWLGGDSVGTGSPDWTRTANNLPKFGFAVASAGDVNDDCYDDVIVGMPGSTGSDNGEVFVWHGKPSGLGVQSDWWLRKESKFGYSVASAGDVNGDRFDDIIVGSPRKTNYQGEVYIYAGGPSGLSTTPFWSTIGDTGEGRFGHCVASAGDVNGDCFDDVIVGQPGREDSPNYQGKAFIFLGASGAPGDEMSQSSFWAITGQQDDARFGASLAAGDVDGNGLQDVVIGEPEYDDGSGEEVGRVHVFLGQP